MIRILHTADLHLGKSFSKYAGIQDRLTRARYEALERLVETANERGCSLFVVAGDLFDKRTVSISAIERAAGILNRFEGDAVAVLPGNHDYVSSTENDLWARFEEETDSHVLVLDGQQPYNLQISGRSVSLWPGPCDAKHSPDNAVDWMREQERPDHENLLHIGIAHGSLKGVSPDFEGKYFPMTEGELEEIGLDLWLLGHTHIWYPPTPGKHHRIYYCGTPEPDGFDCSHDGHAWLITMDDGKNLAAEPISSGSLRFCSYEWEFGSGEDVAEKLKQLEGDEHANEIAKVTISGLLRDEEFDSVDELRGRVESAVLSLVSWNTFDLGRRITEEDIDKTYTEDSFPHRLLSSLADEDRAALQAAYELIKEVQA